MVKFGFGFRPLLCAALALATVGCAPAYHSYRPGCGECIEYGYCPPAPLPYTTYCGCPTPIASCYSSHRAPTPAPAPDDSLRTKSNEVTIRD